MTSQVSISESFLESMSALDPVDAKRAASFVDKLLRAPTASSLRPEIVHDAADRAVRSFKVTHDLRAITYMNGDELLLLFVGRHDRAYSWAKARCVTCSASTGELLLITENEDAPASPLHLRACSTSEELCRLLDDRSILHDLGA